MAAEGMRILSNARLESGDEVWNVYHALKKILRAAIRGQNSCRKLFTCESEDEETELRLVRDELTRLGYCVDYRETQVTKRREMQRCNIFTTTYTRIMNISW